MTENTGYRTERLSAANFHHLPLLDAAVYNRTVPEGFYQRKYNTAYTGLERIGFIAFSSDGTAIGYYGVIPCFLRYRGRQIISAQSADTMTHPGYRFKGLFVELARLTYALCKENGIGLVIGFPNQNSYHGAVQKLGWKMTDTMSCFTIPVKTIPLEKLAAKFSMQTLYHRIAGSILKKYAVPRTDIGNPLLDEGYGGIDRNAAYMAYKTYTFNQVIRLGGGTAWVKLRNGLVIGDLRVKDEEFIPTLKKLRRLAALTGTRQLQFHISPGTRMHALFTRNYQAAASFPVLFQDLHSGLDLTVFKFSFADIDIF
ncbi:MAG: GNAT family N-acetyltransferase [Chitinophagaceae bacterium]|nr:GNAT family N-acetyltransferase [Chitinophagaceae bacterium]